MFAFQTDIDLETGTAQSATEMAVEAIEADDLINGGYNNDDGQTADQTEDTNNKDEENNSPLFIYQRTFNPNEKAEEMYSLDSEDQDTLKEDSEVTTVANDDGENEEPNDGFVESVDVEALHDELEDEEAEFGTSDENNNENEFDPDLIDDDLHNEEIKALTNEVEANDEETNEEDANEEEANKGEADEEEAYEQEADEEVIVYGYFKRKKYIGRSAFWCVL